LELFIPMLVIAMLVIAMLAGTTTIFDLIG